jgi:hypothetical protein
MFNNAAKCVLRQRQPADYAATTSDNLTVRFPTQWPIPAMLMRRPDTVSLLALAWKDSTVAPEMSKAHTPYKNAESVIMRVQVATLQLLAARKQAIAAYDEDLRALKSLNLKLATVETMQQPELFDVDATLTPELIRLLDSPLAKYQ